MDGRKKENKKVKKGDGEIETEGKERVREPLKHDAWGVY